MTPIIYAMLSVFHITSDIEVESKSKEHFLMFIEMGMQLLY